MKSDIHMSKKICVPSVLLVAVLSLYGCAATGPQFEAVSASLPPISGKNSRLFFYREYAAFGSGMRPDIFVCNKKVGQSVPGGAFYVDLPAGECNVTIPAILYPGQEDLRVDMGPRGVKYVRTWMGGSSFGGRTNMELVPEATAINALQGLAFTTAGN